MAHASDHADPSEINLDPWLESGEDTTPNLDTKRFFKCTDLGNTERFEKQHGERFHFEPTWRKSIVWDGRRWRIGDESHAMRLAMQTVRMIYNEASAIEDRDIRKRVIQHAIESESRARLAAMVDLAQCRLTVSHEQLDKHPMLLNVENGILDLEMQTLRPHDPKLYLTQFAPVRFNPNATCPIWNEFFSLIFNGDTELIEWIQRFLGLCLSGLTTEQILPIFFGSGANGKSTLLNTFQSILGTDYAMKASPNLLMARGSEGHPTERADLFGKRFCSAIETESGKRLAESLVKELTGGDRIRARRMREDFWEFSPTHKVVLATNHKPIVSGSDHAIWRRLRLIPFTVCVPPERQDKQLPDKLLAEKEGILVWLVEGFRRYLADGLGEPACVTEATREYRSSEDVIGEFVAECCTLHASLTARASAIIPRFNGWARENGHAELSGKRIGEYLQTNLGLTKFRSNGITYRGIGLKPEETYPDF
jgi:putative DNA primase/helicase